MPRAVKRSLLAVAVLVVGLVALLAAAGALYTPNLEIPEGLEGKHVDVDGLPVRVHQTGAGRDVLLIHGSPGSVEDWAEVQSALGGSFRVTAFDRPGHGFSGATGEHSFEHNADVALRLIERLGLREVIVVGHSYGGTTALAMARRKPSSVSAYVIVDSSMYEPSRKPNATLRLIDLPLVGAGIASTLGRLRAPALIRAGLDREFANRKAPEEFAALRIRIWSAPKVTRSIARETLDFRQNLAALSPAYSTLDARVFILAQADDPFRRRAAQRLHGEIRGSSLELVPGTGHYVQVEKTAEVVRAVRRAAGLE